MYIQPNRRYGDLVMGIEREFKRRTDNISDMHEYNASLCGKSEFTPVNCSISGRPRDFFFGIVRGAKVGAKVALGWVRPIDSLWLGGIPESAVF
jgi:hypothetical protein